MVCSCSPAQGAEGVAEIEFGRRQCQSRSTAGFDGRRAVGAAALPPGLTYHRVRHRLAAALLGAARGAVPLRCGTWRDLGLCHGNLARCSCSKHTTAGWRDRDLGAARTEVAEPPISPRCRCRRVSRAPQQHSQRRRDRVGAGAHGIEADRAAGSSVCPRWRRAPLMCSLLPRSPPIAPPPSPLNHMARCMESGAAGVRRKSWFRRAHPRVLAPATHCGWACTGAACWPCSRPHTAAFLTS